MLAAAHESDLAAARAVGLATAFIARPFEHGPAAAGQVPVAVDWDLAGATIPAVAAQL
jgi:2-haloacid dehalogenase